MFKLQQIESVRWPVHVRIPRDGGKITAATFHAKYKFVEKDELDEINRSAADDVEFLAAVVLDWEGVADGDEKPIPFNEENLRRLAKVAYIKRAMLAGFYAAINGAAEKNS